MHVEKGDGDLQNGTTCKKMQTNGVKNDELVEEGWLTIYIRASRWKPF